MFKEIRGLLYSDYQLGAFLEDVRLGQLQCNNIVVVNGDRRFWGVDSIKYGFLAQFKQLSIDTYLTEVGVCPKHVVLMVNHITAEDSPEGSGGGWHVDSVRNQYKMFMYLTDCNKVSFGPLTLYSSGSALVDKIVIALNYMMGNKFRFSERFINLLKYLNFCSKPVLKNKNEPFFVNTSYIHRGEVIREGERVLVTAYMFEKDIPASIRERISG